MGYDLGTLSKEQLTRSGIDKPSVGQDAPGCPVPGSFPDPAPAGPCGSSLSVFSGTWNLYVIDDRSFYVASIGGWSLDTSATTPADTTLPTVTDTSPDGTASKTADVTATFSEPV